MSAALRRIDGIDEGEKTLVVTVVVLEGDLDLVFRPARLHVDRFAMQCRLVLVQIPDKVRQTPFVEKTLLLL